MLLEGARTAEVFRAYIAQALGPCLKPGDIVVMGNVPRHRTRGVRVALHKLKVIVPEFPAYSPDLNPIEQAISKLKGSLRKLAPRSLRSLTAGVRKTLRHFSPAECAAYLRHSGSHRATRAADATGFKSSEQAPRFLSPQAMICCHFRPRRHLMTAAGYRRARAKAFRVWR
jgi:transposase